MKLTPPNQNVFWISVVLALLRPIRPATPISRLYLIIIFTLYCLVIFFYSSATQLRVSRHFSSSFCEAPVRTGASRFNGLDIHTTTREM